MPTLIFKSNLALKHNDARTYVLTSGNDLKIKYIDFNQPNSISNYIFIGHLISKILVVRFPLESL